MASGDGNHQQDQANLDKPEAIWLDYIKKNYPELKQHTYFYPPLYFNRVRFAVDEVAGLRVNVTDPNHVPRVPLAPPPVHKKKARAQPSTSSASAGTPSSASSSTRQPPGIFIENPPGLRPPKVQESDQRDDQAQCECLSFLKSISPEEPMVVISQLDFQNYLNVITNPNDEEVIKKLPGLPSDCQKGDWDVLIIHLHFGLIVGEVKAVDGSAEHTTHEAIQKRVEKALEQLKKQHKALVALVKDLTSSSGSGIRITRMLMLPNLTYDQLNAALTNFQQMELRQTLSNSDDPIQTRKHVLCQDDLPRATQWWRDLHRQETDPSMTFDIYERMVARFCGLATTVRIPVPCTLHRSVLRTKAEAVDETSLRYSFLTLTSSQVTLLCEMPDQRRVVYCQGPPGCGKSVVLLLKAMQWVQMEKKVVIISQPSGSAAVSMLIKHQLTKLVGKTAAAKYIRVHSIDFDDDHRLNVHDDVQRLWKDHGLDCAILCDEVPIRNTTNFIPWLTEVYTTSPQNQPMVWMAGVWLRDHNVNALLQLPHWVEVRPMHDPLRCPLTITKAVQESRLMGQYIGPYDMSTRPMHTEGFPVERLQHFGKPGHCAEKDPLLCNQCTDDVAGILKSLGVGERGKPLQYRDVWLLTNGYQGSNEPPMVQRLREIHEMPVASIRGTTLGEADAEELALASTNQIIETHFHMVRGLERSVVVSVATRVQDYEFESISRSISYLICID